MRSAARTRRARPVVRLTLLTLAAVGTVAAPAAAVPPPPSWTPAGAVVTAAPRAAAAPATTPATGAGGATARAAAAGGVPALPVTTRTVRIAARDGVRLTASVSTPQAAGRFPLVVLPGTFAGNSIRLDAVGRALAARGYATVTYIERGFAPSEGLVDGGGPRDVRDVSDVITWGRQNLPTDGGKVGVGGLSYGAGIALQAAAHDSRVGVVAALSGWADLAGALFPNDTRARLTMEGLLAVLYVPGNGRPSDEVLTVFTDAIAGRNEERNLAFARARSASALLDRLAARRVPAFVSLPMNETVFPVDQSIAFWRAYPGPKHLDLRPGDHANSELVAVGDRVSESWTEAFRWFDAHLAGTDRSITREPAVRVVPRSPRGFAPVERAADVVPARTRRLYLRATDQLLGPDRLTLTASPGQRGSVLHEGLNVLARPPFPLYFFAAEATLGLPPSVPLGALDPRVTQLYRTAPLTATMHYRGALEVDLDLVPSAAEGTVVVTAFALKPGSDEGFPIARQPWSWRGRTPGAPLTARFALPYNAFDLPAGYRLGITVGSSDPTWASRNPAGARIRILPTSSVRIPLR